MQSNLGAKNHAVVLPDADVDSTVKALAGRQMLEALSVQAGLFKKPNSH